MGFLNEFFDEIYCINLDRRKDRWEDVQKEFAMWDIKVKRVSAIEGKSLPIHENQLISANEMGCTKSHLSILQEMVDKKYKQVLIFEDDIIFLRDPHAEVKAIAGYLPENWDMLYLSGNQVRPVIKYRSIWKCVRTFTTGAYGITNEFGKKMLETVNVKSRQIDVEYANTHLRGNSFTLNPGCCTQKAGFSDIQQGFVDYTKFM